MSENLFKCPNKLHKFNIFGRFITVQFAKTLWGYKDAQGVERTDYFSITKLEFEGKKAISITLYKMLIKCSRIS